MLAMLQTASLGYALEQVVQPVSIKGVATRPRVLLFLHVGKCGGSTVRAIFQSQKQHWTATYWAMTQRFTGWKSNRILHAIHSQLKHSNVSRVFVEWHLGINFTAVPDLRRFVHIMRPDAEFRVFTILRSPTKLIASNGAYFSPAIRPDVYLRMNAEHLLFKVLNLGREFEAKLASRAIAEGWARPRNASADALRRSSNLLCQEGLDCGMPADAVTLALPSIDINVECAKRAPLCEEVAGQLANESRSSVNARARTKTPVPPAAVTDRNRGRAHDIVEELARRERIVEAFGCAPLVARALEVLQSLDAVMLLEDNQTFQSVHRAALWRPESGAELSLQRDAADTTVYNTPHDAATPESARAPYQTAAMLGVASANNRCGMLAWTKIKRRYAESFTWYADRGGRASLRG